MPLSWTPIRPLGIAARRTETRTGAPDHGVPRPAGWTRPTGKRTNRDGDVCTDATPAGRQATDGGGSPAHSLRLSLSAAHVKSSRAPSFFSSSPSSRCAARVVPPHHCRLLQRHHHTPFFFGDTRTARPLHSCMPCPLHLHSLSLSRSLAALPAYCRYLSPRPPVSAQRASCQLSPAGRVVHALARPGWRLAAGG